MALWKKFWLLFAAIWVVVAGLQAVILLAASEEPEKALLPAVLGVAVPALVYALGLLWEAISRWRGSPPPEK